MDGFGDLLNRLRSFLGGSQPVSPPPPPPPPQPVMPPPPPPVAAPKLDLNSPTANPSAQIQPNWVNSQPPDVFKGLRDRISSILNGTDQGANNIVNAVSSAPANLANFMYPIGKAEVGTAVDAADRAGTAINNAASAVGNAATTAANNFGNSGVGKYVQGLDVGKFGKDIALGVNQLTGGNDQVFNDSNSQMEDQLLQQAHDAFQAGNKTKGNQLLQLRQNLVDSHVQNVQQYMKDTGYDESAGDVIKHAVGTLGTITNPEALPVGAAFGGAIKGAGNVISGKPITEGMTQATQEGANFNAELAPLAGATGKVLGPALDKVLGPEMDGINNYLNLAKNSDSPEMANQIYQLAAKRVVSSIAKAGIEGGIPMGILQGVTSNGQTLQDKVADGLKGLAMGAAFGAGTKGIGIGTDALFGQVIKPAVEQMKADAAGANPQAGFVRIPGAPETPEGTPPSEKDVIQAMKDKQITPEEADYYRQMAGSDVRPQHQAQLEAALNSGDVDKAQQIVDNLDPNDPYKPTMQSLINQSKMAKAGGQPANDKLAGAFPTASQTSRQIISQYGDRWAPIARNSQDFTDFESKLDKNITQFIQPDDLASFYKEAVGLAGNPEAGGINPNAEIASPGEIVQEVEDLAKGKTPEEIAAEGNPEPLPWEKGEGAATGPASQYKTEELAQLRDLYDGSKAHSQQMFEEHPDEIMNLQDKGLIAPVLDKGGHLKSFNFTDAAQEVLKDPLMDSITKEPGWGAQVAEPDLNAVQKGLDEQGFSSSTGEPPGNVKPPLQNAGEVPNPQYIAQQGRLAHKAMWDQIQVRAQTLAQRANQLVAPEDANNFRVAMEDPSKMDQLAAQSSNPEGFKQLAQEYSDFTDWVFGQAKNNEVPIKEVQDYFTHIWDLSTPEAQQKYDDLMAAATRNFKSGFTKQRFIATYQEGLDAGLVPKNETVGQDIVEYARSIGKQIAGKAAVNAMNDIQPNTAVEFAGQGDVPVNFEGRPYLQSNIPGLQGTFIEPNVQKEMGFYNPSALQDNKVAMTADKVNTFMKWWDLGLGGFHGLKTTARQIINDPTIIPTAIQNAFDPNARNAFVQQAIDDGTIDYGTKAGVTYSQSGDLLAPNSSLTDTIASQNPIEKFNQGLFGGLINTYKINLTRQMMDKFDLSDPQQAAEAQDYAQQINNLMGGLNYEFIGRNKTTQQLMRYLLLAPDFNEGKVRQLFTAVDPRQWGTQAGQFAVKNVLGEAAVIATMAELGRKLTTGNFSPTFRDFVANSVLNPNIPLPNAMAWNNPKSGKTQTFELPGSDIRDIAKGIQDPQHFIQARGSALVGKVGELWSGKNYYDQLLVDPFSGVDDNVLNRLKAMAGDFLPIPGVQAVKLAQGKVTPLDAILNVVGGRVVNNPNDPTVMAQKQYFDTMAQAAQGLNPNDQKIFLGIIHPTTKDYNGNPVVDKNYYTNPAKYAALLAHPNVLQAEINLQTAQPSHDPLWDLEPNQIRAYLQAAMINQADPKGDPKTVSALYSMLPQGFFQQRQAFFNTLPQVNGGNANAATASGVTASGGQGAVGGQLPQRPQPDADLQKLLDVYNTLPSGTGLRTAFLQQYPQVLQYFNQSSNFTNAQRADMGLPLLQQGGSSGYSGYGSSYSTRRHIQYRLPKGRSTARAVKLPQSKGTGIPATTTPNVNLAYNGGINPKNPLNTTLKLPSIAAAPKSIMKFKLPKMPKMKRA